MLPSADYRFWYKGELSAGGGFVHHYGNLVTTLAVLNLGGTLDVVPVDAGQDAVFGLKLEGVLFTAVDGVLDVATAFDFPAVVDVAAARKQCQGR